MKVKAYINQLAKNTYMAIISLLSKRNVSRKSKPEIAYLLSFPENDAGLIQTLTESFPSHEVVIYYTANCLTEAISYQENGLKSYPLDNTFVFFTKIIPNLARSQAIICDNYFPFLGGLTHQAEIIQLWHANGAIKQFGWEDQKTKQRTAADKKRFQAVYDQFDRFLIGSDQMGQIFVNSYRVSRSKLLPLGVPRTDYFFREEQKNKAIKRFKQVFPEAIGKRILVYAPTYRDHEFELADWQAVLSNLEEESILICHLHPHMTEVYSDELLANPAIFTSLRGISMAELLFSTDCLISDYSSVPFEYALANLQGQLLFFCPDVLDYQQNVGLQADFLSWTHAKRSETTAELIVQINNRESIDISELNTKWNQYNDGYATKRFLNYLADKLKNEG